MSFKDSVMRGLALYGISSMAQSGMYNGKIMVDALKDVEKNAR